MTDKLLSRHQNNRLKRKIKFSENYAIKFGSIK